MYKEPPKLNTESFQSSTHKVFQAPYRESPVFETGSGQLLEQAWCKQQLHLAVILSSIMFLSIFLDIIYSEN